jgi:hypothetical protein
MKKFAGSFEIKTKLVPLSEIARLIQVPISANRSYSVGEEESDGNLFLETLAVVELESEYSDLSTLMECLRDKIESIPIDNIFASLADVKISIYVAAFYDTAYCSLSILPQHADFFGRRNITIDIFVYPVNKDGWND